VSNKTLTILTILGLAGIIVFTVTQTPANCWDKYETERDAIMHCEEN